MAPKGNAPVIKVEAQEFLENLDRALLQVIKDDAVMFIEEIAATIGAPEALIKQRLKILISRVQENVLVADPTLAMVKSLIRRRHALDQAQEAADVALGRVTNPTQDGFPDPAADLKAFADVSKTVLKHLDGLDAVAGISSKNVAVVVNAAPPAPVPICVNPLVGPGDFPLTEESLAEMTGVTAEEMKAASERGDDNE